MPEPPLTRDAVIDLVRKAEIVDDDVLSSFMSHGPGLPPTASDTASRLIAAGLLTSFQARLILQGRYKGFRLGPYKILDQIGAGGMGQVFLAEHTTMRRKVALKVLPPKQAADRVGVERFYREARAVAALNHPNIVRAHDVGFDRGSHFLVLEYVEGIDLGSRMKEAGGRIPVGEAVGYAVQAAAGLQHAHAKGLVHRDIKPQNLLVDKDGVLKILDMGLARFFTEDEDRLTQKLEGGGVMGTADYVSPEQLLDSADFDHRADIYSLGATIYHLLTGVPPFSGNTTAKLVAHQLHVATPANEVCFDIPEEVSDAIEKMMEKNADDRYQSASELIPDLLPFVGDPRRGPVANLPALAVAGLGQSTANLATALHRTAELSTALTKAQKKKMVALAALGGVIVAAGLVIAVVIATRPDRPVAHMPPTDGPKGSTPVGPQVNPNVPTLVRALAGSKSELEDVMFLPDGKHIIAGAGDRTIRIWDAATGEQTRSFVMPGRLHRSMALLSGNRLVAVDSKDPTVRTWDLASGTELRQFPHEGGVISVAAMPGGRRFLTCGNRQPVRLWDADSGEELQKFDTGVDARGLAVTPDGTHFLLGGDDKTLRLWDMTKNEEVRMLSLASVPWRVGVSPDGQWAGVGSNSRLMLWNLKTFETRVLSGASAFIDGVAFTPDGRHVLALSENHFYVWNVASGQMLARATEHRGNGRHVSVSADGHYALTSSTDRTAVLWKLPESLWPK